jgi:hypothetical protein
LLVLALVLPGCKTGEEPDGWSSITDLSRADGRWSASFSESENGVTTAYQYAVNVYAKKKMASLTATMTFSGSSVSAVWSAMKGAAKTKMETDGTLYAFDDSKYSITVVTVMDASGFQISADGTQIRVSGENIVFSRSGNDGWSNITSLSEIEGTWEGSFEGVRWLSEIKGGSVANDAKIPYTYAFSLAVTSTASLTAKLTFDCNAAAWDIIKVSVGGNKNDGDHSTTGTEPIDSSDVIADTQRYSDGTKIRIPAGPEIILFKK